MRGTGGNIFSFCSWKSSLYLSLAHGICHRAGGMHKRSTIANSNPQRKWGAFVPSGCWTMLSWGYLRKFESPVFSLWCVKTAPELRSESVCSCKTRIAWKHQWHGSGPKIPNSYEELIFPREVQDCLILPSSTFLLQQQSRAHWCCLWHSGLTALPSGAKGRGISTMCLQSFMQLADPSVYFQKCSCHNIHSLLITMTLPSI